MTNILFIRDTLYKLKQDYGYRMDLYVPDKSTVNYETGKQTGSKRRYAINKVILLPEILTRRLVQEAAFLAGGRNFAFGGLFDEGKRTVILDGRDIPKGVRLDQTCYMVYQHVRYDLDKIDELEHRCGFVMTMNKVQTNLPREIMDGKAESNLQWSQYLTMEVINA